MRQRREDALDAGAVLAMAIDAELHVAQPAARREQSWPGPSLRRRVPAPPACGRSFLPGGSDFRYVAIAVRSASREVLGAVVNDLGHAAGDAWRSGSVRSSAAAPCAATVHRLRRLSARQASTVSPAR